MGDDGTAAVIFDSTGLKRVVERTVLPFTPLERMRCAQEEGSNQL